MERLTEDVIMFDISNFMPSRILEIDPFCDELRAKSNSILTVILMPLG